MVKDPECEHEIELAVAFRVKVAHVAELEVDLEPSARPAKRAFARFDSRPSIATTSAPR